MHRARHVVRRGVVFVDSSVFGSLVVSYRDPDCDLDGPADEEGGVGQLGENDFLDVDGDGIPNLGFDGEVGSRMDPDFDDDNCFDPETLMDVANPGQEDRDSFCVDAGGATDGTFCISDASCAANAAVGFETCRGDRVGDLCDNCPFDFNPDQADKDSDGIGDACELDGDDLDGDGIANRADNCPTLFNPAQIDTNSNGIGDACDGADDMDADGVPDGADNCPAVLNLQQSDADGYGIGDACEDAFEDWDFDSVRNVQDNCPTVFNPADSLAIQADLDGDGRGDACDPDSDDDDGDGSPDDLLQFFVATECARTTNFNGAIEIVDIKVMDAVLGDGDGILDAGETVGLDVTVRNLARDSTGAPIALHDVSVVLQLQDPSLGCLLDDTVFYGDFDFGETKGIPAEDRFRLTLLRSPAVQTLDLKEVKQVTLRATVAARPR